MAARRPFVPTERVSFLVRLAAAFGLFRLRCAIEPIREVFRIRIGNGDRCRTVRDSGQPRPMNQIFGGFDVIVSAFVGIKREGELA